MIITQRNPTLTRFINADKKARQVMAGTRALPDTLTWADVPRNKKQAIRALRAYFMVFK